MKSSWLSLNNETKRMKRRKLKVSGLRKCRSSILQFVRDEGILKSSNISNGGNFL